MIDEIVRRIIANAILGDAASLAEIARRLEHLHDPKGKCGRSEEDGNGSPS